MGRRTGIAIFAFAMTVTACDGVRTPLASLPYCNDTPASRLASETVSTVTYHLGPDAQRQAQPSLTISEPAAIEKVMQLVSRLNAHWYQPAGETYDPASVRPVGEATLVFWHGGRELDAIAIGVNYIEGSGCGTHITRHIMAGDRSMLLNTIGHPVP